MIQATTKVCLENRWGNASSTHSVRLRVTYDRQQKYYSTGIKLTTDDWERCNQPNPRGQNRVHKLFFNEIEKKANDIIKQLNPFSFAEFERKFNQKTSSRKDVFDLLSSYAVKLKDENRINTANSFLTTVKSLERFTKKKKLPLTEISPEWLLSFENWMIKNGNSLSTTGVYIRNLRTIFNIAIEEGNFNRDYYPFGKRKYQIPASRNIKKALSIKDVEKIFKYSPENEAEEKSRDLWIFSYLCNGANITDIVKLQYKNITKTNITFIRTKTVRSTKTDQKSISIVILPEISTIIQKWGVKPESLDNFVFGFIDENDGPERRVAKTKQTTKTINKYTKRIGINLEIEIPLTIGCARHSYATILKRSGTPIAYISEALGHHDQKITEIYLDSFEDEAKFEIQQKLMNW